MNELDFSAMFENNLSGVANGGPNRDGVTRRAHGDNREKSPAQSIYTPYCQHLFCTNDHQPNSIYCQQHEKKT